MYRDCLSNFLIADNEIPHLVPRFKFIGVRGCINYGISQHERRERQGRVTIIHQSLRDRTWRVPPVDPVGVNRVKLCGQRICSLLLRNSKTQNDKGIDL